MGAEGGSEGTCGWLQVEQVLVEASAAVQVQVARIGWGAGCGTQIVDK